MLPAAQEDPPPVATRAGVRGIDAINATNLNSQLSSWPAPSTSASNARNYCHFLPL